MKIIICGAGRVGQAIARHLEREDATITVVDEDSKRLDEIATELRVSDTIQGNACDRDILDQAGANDCDMIVAVTSSDETNFVVCRLATELFGVPDKIARMREAHYTQLIETREVFNGIVDVVIQPEIDVAKMIVRNIVMPENKFYCELADGQVRIIALKLGSTEKFGFSRLKTIKDDLEKFDKEADPEFTTRYGKNPDEEEQESTKTKETENSTLPRAAILGFVDPQSKDLEFKQYIDLTKDEREGNGTTEYTVYFTIESSVFDKFIAEFIGEEEDLSRVLIVGGGHIGYNVAKEIEKKKRVNIRLIEQNPAMADRAAESLKRTSVLVGDGLDRKMLEEAKVADTDCVLATTGDDKTNIMICLFAEFLQAKHSFAMINDRNLKSFSESSDIDTVVSMRLQTLSKVIDRIRGDKIRNTRVIEDGRAEILEGHVDDHSHICDEEVNEFFFGKNKIKLVAVIRPPDSQNDEVNTEDKIFLPREGFKFKAKHNDRLILLCQHHKETMKTVVHYFSLAGTYA